MSFKKDKKYNIVFIDCSFFIANIYHSIVQLIEGINVNDKDFNKLLMHFFITELLNKSKKKTFKERPVYIFYSKGIKNISCKRYLKSFIYTLKKLRTLLPVPILVIEEDIFKVKNGDYKEVCERVNNFYYSRKFNSRKLKEFLEIGEYYELIKVFNNIINIKSIST